MIKTGWDRFWWFGYPAINLVSALIYIGICQGIADCRIQEQRDYYDFGDSLNYITYFGPVFLVCLILGLIFVGVVIYEYVVNHRWKMSAITFGVVFLIWAGSYGLTHYMSKIPSNT